MAGGISSWRFEVVKCTRWACWLSIVRSISIEDDEYLAGECTEAPVDGELRGRSKTAWKLHAVGQEWIRTVTGAPRQVHP